MSQHAVLSPSKASRWINCPGSIALCADIPNTTSVYADEGTAAHAVAAARLNSLPAVAASPEISDYIDVYVEAVRNAAGGKTLYIEQHLNIERWTSEKGGKGTADAVIVNHDKSEIEVWDLKFGMGHVVYAENNEQLMLYALGALELAEMVYDEFKTIKLVICQPRRDHLSEHTMSRVELLAFGEKARAAGEIALDWAANDYKTDIMGYLSPSESACLFCPAKATCPALADLVQTTVFEEFSTVEYDGAVKTSTKPIEAGDVPTAGTLNLISDWVKAKEARIDSQLRSGVDMPGWKLVLGKKGNRKFTDLLKVAKLLKSLKFKKDQIYETSLIPLTKIEKLVPKPKWPVFEKLITQSDPQPISVAASDKRPAWSPSVTAESFSNEEVDYSAFT